MATFAQALVPVREAAESLVEVLLVRIGREYAALPLQTVEAHHESVELCPLPDWRQGVAGLLRCGSHFVPVYRPEEVLGIPRDDTGIAGGAVVLLVEGQRAAIAIDEALDVLAIEPDSLRLPPPVIAEDGVVAALLWSDGRLVALLDPRALLEHCRRGEVNA